MPPTTLIHLKFVRSTFSCATVYKKCASFMPGAESAAIVDLYDGGVMWRLPKHIRVRRSTVSVHRQVLPRSAATTHWTPSQRPHRTTHVDIHSTCTSSNSSQTTSLLRTSQFTPHAVATNLRHYRVLFSQPIMTALLQRVRGKFFFNNCFVIPIAKAPLDATFAAKTSSSITS